MGQWLIWSLVREVNHKYTINSLRLIKPTKKLDRFISDSSLSAILARLTAYDSPSFNIFVTSSDVRKSLSAIGHSLPNFVNGIKAQDMNCADNLR